MNIFPLKSYIDSKIQIGRSEFELTYPGGDYVKFEGTLPDAIKVKGDGTVDVGISDIEIIERGNRLCGNAADEMPQVSL